MIHVRSRTPFTCGEHLVVSAVTSGRPISFHDIHVTLAADIPCSLSQMIRIARPPIVFIRAPLCAGKPERVTVSVCVSVLYISHTPVLYIIETAARIELFFG